MMGEVGQTFQRDRNRIEVENGRVVLLTSVYFAKFLAGGSCFEVLPY